MNECDVERLECKYRKVLKCMMSLPDCISSAAVYLSIGLLPASAQRDVDILGLLRQLALCDPETQKVRTVVEHTLLAWYHLVRSALIATIAFMV